MLSRKTIKTIAAVIAILLIVSMVGGSLISAIGMAQAVSISDLKGQLSSIDKQKAEIKALLKSLEGQIDSNTAKKQALEHQMDLTKEDINTTEQLIKGLEADISQKEEEIVQAQKDLDIKTELFETRVRVMYENGNITYLDVLLNAESFSDMLSRIEIVGQIMDYDKKVVEEYQAAKKALEDAKASLEQDKADQVTYKSQLQSKYDDLDDQKGELQSVLSKLEDNYDQQKKESEKLEAEQDSINSEIERLSKIEAEKARKAAEAAAAAAAAKKANGGSGGSSGGISVTYTGTGSLSTWPTPGYGITGNYGWRIHPIYKTRKFHKGADIAAPKGTVIRCAGNGTVVKSYLSSSYGNYVVVSHGGGLMSAYAHMSKRSVSVGDSVSAGQQLGLVGSTGNSTGNHLHFEVYEGGSTVNPTKYFG